jgi:hypothetical protein
MTIPLFQWTPDCSALHFGCVYKKVKYWRTFGTGSLDDKWDVCKQGSWHKTKPQISRLSYLVITGEHFDIEKVIKEANRK